MPWGSRPDSATAQESSRLAGPRALRPRSLRWWRACMAMAPGASLRTAGRSARSKPPGGGGEQIYRDGGGDGDERVGLAAGQERSLASAAQAVARLDAETERHHERVPLARGV